MTLEQLIELAKAGNTFCDEEILPMLQTLRSLLEKEPSVYDEQDNAQCAYCSRWKVYDEPILEHAPDCVWDNGQRFLKGENK